MRTNLGVIVLLVVGVCQGQTPSGDSLPVKRVVLYKNGVAYLEHLGRIRGNQDISVSFSSGQLNDVLKSLTALDLDGGRITGIAYGSSSPVDRQIGELRLSLSDKPTLTEILAALRGAKVEVRNGTNIITGRLLSVERKTRTGSGTTLEVDYVSLLTDAGEVRTTEVSPSFNVRLLERGLPAKIDRLLDLVSKSREPDLRRMTISTAGSGERSLFVSYISEAPVWKTTYRIVLGGKKSSAPLLQGWAIVDNTGGQDWENVSLSLVAGAPQSFIQNLSQPYYARRPVIGLPESMNAAPQTYESTLVAGNASLVGVVRDASGAGVGGTTVKVLDGGGNTIGQTTTDSNGNYQFQSLPEGLATVGFTASGFKSTVVRDVLLSASNSARRDAFLTIGSVAETVTVTAAADSIQTQSSERSGYAGRAGGSGRALGSGGAMNKRATQPGIQSYQMAAAPAVVESARLRAESAAIAQSLEDVYEYKLKEPITIRRSQSALVPIIQSPITAEKVSIWNESSRLSRPQRALWLTNSSGLTLDGGSFTVLEDDTFAGEGIFDPIRPSEKRLVSYAVDLAVTPSARNIAEQDHVVRVRVSKGILTIERQQHEKKTYTFRNEDTTARTVVVEHPVRPGYELRSEVKPSETSAGYMRFRVNVDPKQTASLIVDEVRPISSTLQISNIDSEQVATLVVDKVIDKSLEGAMRKILAQKQVVAKLNSEKDERETEVQAIYDDQQRLRENMKALKGSAEEKALLHRYTQQLNGQENRLETLKKEAERLEAEYDKAQSELDRLIQELNVT